MLADTVVLLYCAHQLTAFKRIVRTRLLYVDVFAGLASPNAHKRMPMIGCGDGDCVDIFIFKQLANIDVSLGLGESELLHVADPLVQNTLVDIAECSNFRSGNFRKPMKMVVAAASYPANCNANTIVRTQYASAEGERCCANGDCFPGRLKKISAIDRHRSTP